VFLPVSVDESAISAKMTSHGHLYLCMPKKGLDIAVGACENITTYMQMWKLHIFE
jgi:hypothetical protein